MSNKNVSMGFQVQDPKTQKFIQHFGNKSIFTVYVRRYNGRMMTLFIGDGDDLVKVLSFYNNYRIYKHDIKYLCHRIIDEPKDTEVKILRESASMTTKFNSKKLSKGPGRTGHNYKVGVISMIQNVPITIVEGLEAAYRQGFPINSTVMTKSRLICILISEFLEMTDKQRKSYLDKGDLLLERHKMASGGLTEERVEKEQAHQEIIENEGGDLL